MMQSLHRHHNGGLTLIEVMVSLLVILLMVVGAVSYMYASAKHAKEADVRAKAARLGLLLMECWKADGVDVTLFNPADPIENINQLPLSDFANPGTLNLNTKSGFKLLQNRCYRIEADKVKYFVELTYDDSITPRILNVYVAWNKGDYALSTLNANPKMVVLADYTYIN